jgi:hypothetical protein
MSQVESREKRGRTRSAPALELSILPRLLDTARPEAYAMRVVSRHQGFGKRCGNMYDHQTLEATCQNARRARLRLI